MRAFKVRRDGVVIIAPAIAYGEMTQDRGRFYGGPVKRAAAEESLFGNLVEPRPELEKFQEAALIARLDLTHCLKPLRKRGRICEARAVVINVIAERAHGRERQVFLQRAARGLKEVFKDPWHRNQRRSGVEAKSALGPKIHLAAEAVALFADGDAPIARQAQSDCQSAKPAADDDHMFHIEDRGSRVEDRGSRIDLCECRYPPSSIIDLHDDIACLSNRRPCRSCSAATRKGRWRAGSLRPAGAAGRTARDVRSVKRASRERRARTQRLSKLATLATRESR